LFIAAGRAEEVLATAHQIWQTEREQARRMRAGETLRRQTAFEREPAHRSVPVGARAEGAAEVAGECEAVGSCDLFEGRGRSLLACVGGEIVARELDGPAVDRDRSVVGPAAERAERIGERGGDLNPDEVVDRLVDVSSEKRNEESGRVRRLLDGIGDERQRAAVECIVDELGRDVEDAVAEAVVGSRRPVVCLVGMQDLQLSRETDPPRAAVAERLHSGCGDADRVGVVPVRLEREGGEVHLCTFEAGRARAEPNRVTPTVAGSFKTIGIDAA
jgi:hypothetical protein